MRRLSLDDVLHVARLASLELTADEADRMRGELSQVLMHFAELEAVDLDGVPPTYHPADTPSPLRPDEPPSPAERVERDAARHDALCQAPALHDGAFCVPRVLDTDGGADG